MPTCSLQPVIGVIFTAVLVVRNVKGNILWGILATWILGMICQACGLYVPNPANGFYSLFPDFSNGLSIPSLAPIFGKLDFSILKTGEFFVIMFAFLFVDMFDTIGTLVGTASRAGMVDKDGNMPQMKEALLADAVGTVAGAIAGTSTVTTFVESASGVEAGGRTGLTAFTTGILFLACMFIAPIAAIIPAAATSSALIYVGILMISGLSKVDFTDIYQTVPAAIMLISMPISGSIGHGIGLALISYTIMKVFTGKAKEVSVLTYIISAIFLLKFFLVV